MSHGFPTGFSTHDSDGGGPRSSLRTPVQTIVRGRNSVENPWRTSVASPVIVGVS